MRSAQVVARSLLPAIAALLVFYPQFGRAEPESEFLLFPFVKASFLSGQAADPNLESDDVDYGIDLFGTVEKGKFRFLGEAMLARHEQEIERFQLGWQIGNHRAWLGRFHNPIGYWNTQFHHGVYLQPSISRPAIAIFEHDQGVLPMHLAGLLIEGIAENGGSGLGYAIALATGPELSGELEPWDVLNPTSGSQGPALTLNLYRQPVAYGPTQYGIFANYTEIPASDRGIDEVRQTIAGAYLNWQSAPWRIIGSAILVRNRLEQAAGAQTGDFFAAYIQAERELQNSWSVFARAEDTFAEDDDAYLDFFPYHLRQKFLAGVRLDFLDQHALTLEVSSNRNQDDRYRELVLQWTAMF